MPCCKSCFLSVLYFKKNLPKKVLRRVASEARDKTPRPTSISQIAQWLPCHFQSTLYEIKGDLSSDFSSCFSIQSKSQYHAECQNSGELFVGVSHGEFEAFLNAKRVAELYRFRLVSRMCHYDTYPRKQVPRSCDLH